jgi:hypothetical protein
MVSELCVIYVEFSSVRRRRIIGLLYVSTTVNPFDRICSIASIVQFHHTGLAPITGVVTCATVADILWKHLVVNIGPKDSYHVRCRSGDQMSVTISERYLAVLRSTRSRPSGGGFMWVRGSYIPSFCRKEGSGESVRPRLQKGFDVVIV